VEPVTMRIYAASSGTVRPATESIRSASGVVLRTTTAIQPNSYGLPSWKSWNNKYVTTNVRLSDGFYRYDVGCRRRLREGMRSVWRSSSLLSLWRTDL
ncbi:hypothetical protein GCK32_021755, partial [Trichostrongylus colubriformis]